jgi:putative transposase
MDSRSHVPAWRRGISRSSFHYESRRTDDVELLERIKEIREKKPRWGYKRVHAKLKKEKAS